MSGDFDSSGGSVEDIAQGQDVAPSDSTPEVFHPTNTELSEATGEEDAAAAPASSQLQQGVEGETDDEEESDGETQVPLDSGDTSNEKKKKKKRRVDENGNPIRKSKSKGSKRSTRRSKSKERIELTEMNGSAEPQTNGEDVQKPNGAAEVSLDMSSPSLDFLKPSPEEKDPKDPKEAPRRLNYFKLYRYADWFDWVCLFVGTVAAVVHGALMPLFAYFFGDMIDSFGPGSDILSQITKIATYVVILGAVAGISGYFQISAFMLSGQRQANRIRHLYFTNVLRQEMGWYDSQKSGELTSRMAGDIILFQEGVSEKVGTFIQYFCMFIGGFAIGFIGSWKLALVILSVVPLLAICGALMGKLLADFATQGQKSYSKAGGIADEVISCIRTVAAFGGEELEKLRYGKFLDVSLAKGERKAYVSGVSLGVTMFIMFGSYALAFWYGSTLVEAGELQAGEVISTFFAVVMGAMALGQAAPSLTSFAAACGAAFELFDVIERKTLIDPMSDEGYKPDDLKGEIEFKDVHFRYPTRSDVPILNGLTFQLKPGQILALVGASGCGKSTTVSLVQRFYDTLEGDILIDGKNVKEYNVRALRSFIGVVSQEPILFDKTIAENIRYGRLDVTQEEIEAACKASNAHDFISLLPQKYETLCGERGAQLSGGQKQRIAIARALVRNPKILLLDEATSALDTKSEKTVQVALDAASKGRTTIVIAHRLSTIRNANTIAVVNKGVIVESGSHDELMKRADGYYKSMVELQAAKAKAKKKGKKSQGDEEEEDDEKIIEHIKAEIPEVIEDKEEDGEKLDEKKKELLKKKGVVIRAFKTNKPEWYHLVIGSVGSVIMGVLFPAFAIILGEITEDLVMFTIDPSTIRGSVNLWCLVFLGLAIAAFAGAYMQVASLGVAGERLTDRMRRMLFSAIVRQDIGFFDSPENGTGVLTTQLANDATQVQGLTGSRLGNMLQILATAIAAPVIGLTACWQIALVTIACLPLLAFASSLQMKLITGFNTKAKKHYEKSGQVATRATENIRTVASLGREEVFMNEFFDALRKPNKDAFKNTQISGVSFGFSEALNFFIFALGFWYGARLVEDGDCTLATFFTALQAILFGAMTFGQVAAMTPDFVKAKIAAASIFQLFDRVPPVDNASPYGEVVEKATGHILFKDVTFKYPSRPDVTVLNKFNLEAKPGQTVALVGSSGCGKSTTIQLLQRFYLPASGNIFLDGMDINKANVKSYRSHFGIVSQEPILFATTIRENIAYGSPTPVTDDEIIAAAKAANVHNFIMSLPEGYNTEVGEKGTQLSGGQKQRVAIARAMIRNPKILLLDEATSALDSESEKIVQEALDKVRLGRTTLVIAHRLSTIQNSDLIVVIDKGNVVEMGTHKELINKKGVYFTMVNSQTLL